MAESWNYRDPDNFVGKRPGSTSPGANYGDDDYNPHAYEMFDPLYHYSFGDVRDAAEELEIGNYNKKEEVDRTIEFLQNRFQKQEDVAAEPEPEPISLPDSSTSFEEADSVSEQLASARAYAPLYEEAMRTGSLNPTSDDYQQNADDFLTAYTNRFMDISNRVRGMA
jgi:hypothetical protein